MWSSIEPPSLAARIGLVKKAVIGYCASPLSAVWCAFNGPGSQTRSVAGARRRPCCGHLRHHLRVCVLGHKEWCATDADLSIGRQRFAWPSEFSRRREDSGARSVSALLHRDHDVGLLLLRRAPVVVAAPVSA